VGKGVSVGKGVLVGAGVAVGVGANGGIGREQLARKMVRIEMSDKKVFIPILSNANNG